MQSEWKSNIGEYLTKKGIYRLKFLNEKLYEYCSEYKIYLNEFQGVHTSLDKGDYIGFGLWETVLYIDLDLINTGRINNVGFIFSCRFNERGNLFMKYSTGYNWEGRIKATVKGIDNNDFHSYKDEEIFGTETLEKEYIFQLINYRLISYAEALLRKYRF
jgi:hypothetical protein